MDNQNWEIAVNRFGLGARYGEHNTRPANPKKWLVSQLKPLHYSSNFANSNDLLRLLKQYKKGRKLEKITQIDTKEFSAESNSTVMSVNLKDVKKKIQSLTSAITRDTIQHAINTDFSFQARLVDFFSNHFSVSAKGTDMRAIAPTLEREAIAPYLSGSFSDMLLAVEKHPAMLIYLDNQRSIGPESRVGKKRKKRGLNENLAREILELHTLGVNAGYTQNDVKEFAMAITGWSVATNKNDIDNGFVFRKNTHQPGTRNILGKKYANTQSTQQGETILQELAIHPATAKHLCFKLVRHFINDKPDILIVEELSKVWIKSKGDLTVVLTALVSHPLSWKSEQVKYKSPREFVLSCYRACNSKNIKKAQVVRALLILGQKPFSAGSPAGFGDTADSWDGSEALLARLEWVAQFSSKLKFKSEISAIDIAQSVLGKQLSKRTALMVNNAESREQALTLFFMSPDFLRR